MELYIGGGIILIYLGIVIGCVVWALIWMGQRRFGALSKGVAVLAVLIIAYAIPFGDHTIGLIKFKKLCNEQAGIKVYQTVEGVEGFIWGTGRQAKPFTTYGYEFFESWDGDTKVVRYVRNPNGSITEISADKPRAKYLVRAVRPSRVGKHVTKREFAVSDLTSTKKLASRVYLYYDGGWLIRSLSGMGVGGGFCPEELSKLASSDFVKSVLIPVITEEGAR